MRTASNTTIFSLLIIQYFSGTCDMLGVGKQADSVNADPSKQAHQQCS